MTTPIEGGWLELASGKKWYIENPRSEDVEIGDIAGALSKLCRFGGHTKWFYSVAQHCAIAADVALRDGLTYEEAFHVLMHDAGEAYLVDMPRPVKMLLPQYKDLERKTEEAIAERYMLDYPWPDYVKEYDNRMLITEQRDLMPAGQPYLADVYSFSYFMLTASSCLTPLQGEQVFTNMFYKLVGVKQ